MIKRYNSDLANNLGNLVSRTIAMTKKYFDGIIPSPTCPEQLDDELKAAASAAVSGVYSDMNTYHIANALDRIFTMLRRANKYIDETTPWALAKDESSKARLGTVLYNLLETIRIAGVLLMPFIPETAGKILKQIGANKDSWESVQSFGALEAGRTVEEAENLFARIDEQKMLAEVEAEHEAAIKAAAPAPEKPEEIPQIDYDTFMSTELRCAKVLACEPVPKAKKLLKLQLDLGYEKRQVVSGIAKFYTPEALIGKKIALVCNLKPVTLCGVESNGMILASGEEDIKVIFLDDSVPCGSRIR